MINCPDYCPQADMMKFVDYYGMAEYGDHWIRAAFDGRPTEFKNGNANFSLYADRGSRAGKMF